MVATRDVIKAESFKEHLDNACLVTSKNAEIPR